MTASPPRALFAISSLGLGHATRSLAVIHDYLDRGWQLTIISSGGALELMRRELQNRSRVSFREMADYPPLERGTGRRFYWYLLTDLVATWRMIRAEHRQLRRIESDYDFIFSDGRYGFFSRTTHCFILTHQIAFLPPRLLRWSFRLTARLNLLALRRFDTILIPDYPDQGANLGGRLSHSRHLERYQHAYVGILSSYLPLQFQKDIDYLFIISGYLLEHKDQFVRTLMVQSARLPGKKVFALGQSERPNLPVEIAERQDLEIHHLVDGKQRQELFNRARRVVSRAGYTTIMDLVEHGLEGLLIPTPNQTEQEYLADYLGSRNHFVASPQHPGFDLGAAAARLRFASRFNPPWRTTESVKRIRDCIARRTRARFFSIIVPAHNEEQELCQTLRCLRDQHYPKDRYEIIVVENGSTDATLTRARQFAARRTAGRSLRILQSSKGVAQAKNAGLAEISPDSEWVVFCDADTRLAHGFLRELNTHLSRETGLAVGTCSILPHSAHSPMARYWFRLYDWIHRWTKTSYALQFAPAPLARRIGFRPGLEVGEDLLFIRECRRTGRFFFLRTDQVSTSTRRFQATGYLKLGLYWTLGALLPVRFKRHWKYDVIR